MDPAHRDILRRHREPIVRDLKVDRVKDTLIQNDVFDAGQWESIAKAGKGTRREQASALMDELPGRGPRAFWCFCESLMTGGYDFLGKPLIEEGKRILAECTASIRQEYRKMLKNIKLSLLLALKEVAQFKKFRYGKVSEQTVSSLKYIKEALESISFDESQKLALNEIMGFVEKLKLIRDELERYGYVPEYVKKLNSMLAEEADFSTLYDHVKCNIGSNYLNYFSLQWVTASDISKFGSVLVFIPYLCDISEQAVRKMGPQSFSSQVEGAESRTDVDDVERENLSLDTGEQDDTPPEDELAESGYMEGAEMSEQEHISQHEELLQGVEKLLLSNNMEMKKMMEQKMDELGREFGEKLGQQNTEIKACLSDVSSHLKEIQQALGGQTKMTHKVSKLEKRVQYLLTQEINRTTIKWEIKDIEREVAELKEQFQGGGKIIQDGLGQIDKQLHDMLMTLESDSMDQQQLSAAIYAIITELPFKFNEFAQNLGFSVPEIDEIRSSGDLYKQRFELLQQWRERKGSEATVAALAQACRSAGLSTLADRISLIPLVMKK